MTETTQLVHAARYRISQGVTRLSRLYPDPKQLRRVVAQMVEYEISAIEAERAANLSGGE